MKLFTVGVTMSHLPFHKMLIVFSISPVATPRPTIFFKNFEASIFMGVIMKLPLTAAILSLEMTFDYNVVIDSDIALVLIEYFSNQYFSIKKNYVNKAE